ncbi:MAG: c-type cytochrome [Phycisphaerales bacterium]|nr:c-type cytochrome [Phycisphaerales bacterium]
MRRVMLGSMASVMGFLLAGCGDFWPGKPQPAVPVTLGTEAGFLAAYGSKCAACHGDNGRSGAARPLNDPLYLAITPKTAFAQAVGHGQGTLMPAYLAETGGPWSDERLDAFVDDVYTFWGDAARFEGQQLPQHAPSPGNAEKGASSFATWCGACHGDDGAGLDAPSTAEGVVNGHSVINRFYLQLISDQGLRSAVIFGHEEYGMPSFRGPFPGRGDDGLDEDTINDITAWLISHRVTPASQASEATP